MKRLSLQLKFGLVIVVLLALIFGVIAAILIRQNSRSLQANLNDKAKLFATLATTPIGNTFLTYQDSGQIKITQAIQSFTDLSREISDVAIVDTGGQVVFNQDPKHPVSLDADAAATFKPLYTYDSGGIVTRIVQPLLEENGAHRYNLVYDVSSADIITAIHHTEVAILWSVVLGLVVSVGLTYLLTNQLFIRPLRQVSVQALTISGGRLDQPVVVGSHDEVGDLAQAVNTMAESLKADIAKLQEVDQLKTEFLMIASHNLRTPLTIINGYMERLDEFKVNRELRQIFDIMTVSGKRLAAFAEDMLTISQIEAGHDVFNLQPTVLADLVGEISRDFSVLAGPKGVTYQAEIKLAKVKSQVSPPHLRSALWNLFDNALKFTAKGGQIKLEATAQGQQAQITVSDTGIGIAAAEMPKLFTKFHRGTSTLEYQYEGTGIGLYASKLLIERMGGTIKAESQLGQGSTFTVTLPLLPAD